MKVKDIMSTVALRHCDPETKLIKIANTVGKFGVLPIMDKDRKVIGILTNRDIALAVAQSRAKPVADTAVK